MIPLRYQNAKYENVPLEIREKFEVMRDSRRGLYIHGQVGSGKTYMLYALYAAVDSTIKGQKEFWNTTELLDEMRSDFDRPYEQKKYVEEDMRDVKKLLFLDDIGSEKISDWAAEKFYLIINKRYNHMMPTIFSSNYDLNDLAERVGDRITSRIVEMCDVIELNSEDRRMASAKKITV